MARPLVSLLESMKTFRFQSQQRLKKKLVSIMSFHGASHTRKKSLTQIEEETSTTTTTSTCQSGKKLLKKLNSSIGSKTHHLIVKMASWRKAHNEGDGDEDEDEDNSGEAIWRRKIIMGGRCQPLEFSGRILYDCDGNLLPNGSLKRNQSSISK